MTPVSDQPNRPARVSILDTTLRDGEQTPGVAYRPAEKLHIARVLLEQVGVDRIEIGSAGVSDGEREAGQRIVDWARGAGLLERVEMLGFCDGDRSPRWLTALGVRCMNLLAKGSEAHCRGQLGQSPEQHFVAIDATLRAAATLGVRVTGAYLEDFSRGWQENPAYVRALTARLLAGGVQRIFLADTLGCLSPDAVQRQVQAMCAVFPGAWFEFHAHDDYGLATANTLAAVRAGARGVHTTVNGLGERAGNASLGEVVAALHDHGGVCTGVVEAALSGVARAAETFSGKLLADNAPIVGRDVFTQTAGVHADGDRKGGLYMTRLSPERFGRRRDYALGKLAGKASIDQHLERLGLALEPAERDRLLARVVELGDQKRIVHASDLPFLINDVLGRGDRTELAISDYAVQVRHGAAAQAQVELRAGKRSARAEGSGSGGYEALLSALRRACAALDLCMPQLLDFRVRIPTGGDGAALVETVIVFQGPQGPITVVGVDADQIGAAVIATEKVLQECA